MAFSHYNVLGGEIKMRKQFAVAAIITMFAMLVMLVVSGTGGTSDTQMKAINEEMTRIVNQEFSGSMIEGKLSSVEALSASLREMARIVNQEFSGSMMKGELPSVEAFSATLGYPTEASPDKSIKKCIYGDITGDSFDDVLVHVVTKDPTTNTSSTAIIAVDGSDGTKLWSKNFEYCVLLARPISDFDGDKKTDAIISGIYSPEFPEEEIGKIIAVNGLNGTELWSKEVEAEFLDLFLEMGAIPANLTSASNTDVIINSIRLNLLLEAITSEITALNGANGEELWAKPFTGSLAFGSPVDLTNDGQDEVVISSIELLSTKKRSDVIAVQGDDGTEVWSKQYSDIAIAVPVADITGDGAKDLTVEIGCCELEALKGDDGEKLWRIEV